MDTLEFQRVAPRYLDGESGEQETRSIQSLLLRNSDNQRQLDLLEVERGWIAEGFRREPEDISSIVIRVRRRNPHRRFYVSPLASLVCQFAALGTLFFVLSVLLTDMAAPEVLVNAVDGRVVADAALLTEGERLERERPLEVPDHGQIALRMGSADLLRINQRSKLTLLAPRTGARRAAHLERGEVWANFIQSQDGFLLLLAPNKDISLHGRRAEINAIVGADACAGLMPRRTLTEGAQAAASEVSALVRLIGGSAALVAPTLGRIELQTGKVYIVHGDGSRRDVEVLDDPDALSWSLLRLDVSGRFKQRWDWLHPEQYPLGRELATFELWTALMDGADELERRRASVTRRDGAAEFALFQSLIGRNLERAREHARAAGTLDALKSESRQAEVLRAVKVNDILNDALLDAWAVNHHDVLVVVSESVRRFVESWLAARERPRGDHISDALKVIGNLENDEMRQVVRAERSRERLMELRRDLTRIEAVMKERLGVLEQAREAERSGKEGGRLDALRELIAVAEREIARIEGLEAEVDILRLALSVLEKDVEKRRADWQPASDELARLDVELADVIAGIDKNAFDTAALEAARKDAAKAQLALSQAMTRRDELKAEETRLVREKAGVEHDLESARDEIADASRDIEKLNKEIEPLRAKLPEAEGKVEAAHEGVRAAEEAYERLPPDKRKDSAEERALAEARAEVTEAERTLAAVHTLLSAPLERLEETQAKLASASAANETLGKKLDETNKAIAVNTLQLRETDGAIDKHSTILADAREREADQLHEQELLARLVARREKLEAAVGELRPRVEGLRESLNEAERKALPKRERHASLLADIKTLAGRKAERDDLYAQVRRIFALEEQVDLARRALLETQNQLIEHLVRLAEGQGETIRVVSSASSDLDAETRATLSRRHAAARRAADPRGSQDARGQAASEAHTLGEELEGALRAHIAAGDKSVEAVLIDAYARRFALTCARAVALRVEHEVIEANTRAVAEYDQFRTRVTGFQPLARADDRVAADGTSSGPAPNEPYEAAVGSLLHLLTAAAKTPAGAWEGLEPEKRTELVRAQWELFFQAGVSGLAARKNEAPMGGNIKGPTTSSSSRSYYALFRANPDSLALREIEIAWRTLYAGILSAEERAAVEARRRS